MEAVKDAISAIRARRAEMNVPPSRKAQVIIVAAQPGELSAGRPLHHAHGLRQRA